MTKLLNLDELPAARVDRTIILGGKRHEMQVLSVGRFIEQQKMAMSLVGNEDPAKEIGALIDMIHSVFPSMERAELEALSFDRIMTIFEFLNDQASEVPAEAKSQGK